MIEVWFTNSKREDTGQAPESLYLDMDFGKDNDYKLTLPIDDYDRDKMMAGGYFYVPDEEYGGMLQNLSVDTYNSTVSFEGNVFRGMLAERYVEPPNGQDYLVVSGDIHSSMRSILVAHFGPVFAISGNPAGINATVQINRFCSVLEALEQIASAARCRISLRSVVDTAFHIEISAEPIRDISDDIEVSQDYGINFEISKVTKRYDYMLALGQGELKDRTVKRFHLKNDGTVETVTSFPVDAMVYKLDYPNAESEEQLQEEAIKKFQDINQTDSQKIKVKDDINLNLGEIVGGRDYVTGMYISEPVTRVIVKYSKKMLTKSYEIGVI